MSSKLQVAFEFGNDATVVPSNRSCLFRCFVREYVLSPTVVVPTVGPRVLGQNMIVLRPLVDFFSYVSYVPISFTYICQVYQTYGFYCIKHSFGFFWKNMFQQVCKELVVLRIFFTHNLSVDCLSLSRAGFKII